MSKQDNSSSDKSSSKSQADLYEKAKDYWTQEIQGLLDNMIDGVNDISDWLLTSKEIDHLVNQVTNKKGSIKSSFAFQLRKNLNDFKNMRRTRSHKDMAQGWRGSDSIAREGPAQNAEMKSNIKQYSEEYFDINATLFQRLQICVNRSGVDEKENPMSVQNLCFSFRNSIDSLNLETKYEAALYRYFSSKVLSNLPLQYQKIDDLLAKQGILLDSKSADLAPGVSQEANTKKSPVPRGINTTSKNPENLNQTEPPESMVISRNFELLCLLQEFKKKTQLASSRFNNTLTDLKQELARLKITSIDKEVDHVSFLFNFVFRNKDLPDEIKAQLARLQIYVLLSAMNETGFLENSSNPTHMLIDKVIEAEIDLAESGSGAQSGKQVLSNGIDRLIESRTVTLKSYAELLEQYQTHIDIQQKKILDDTDKEKFKEQERLKKIEEARLDKLTKEQQLKKAREEQRLKKIEQARLQKIEEARLQKIAEQQRQKEIEDARQEEIAEQKRLKNVEEQERLEKIEKDRLKRIEEEKRLKRIEEEKRLKQVKERERLKQIKEHNLKKQKREKELKHRTEQIVKMKRLVRSTVEEITIPLLALNKPFILFNKVWSPLLLQIALTDGIKSPIWQKTIKMVRSQVWSLIPKSSASDLQKLNAIQPHILHSLVRGMHSLELSSSLQKSLTEYLKLEYEEVIKQSKTKIRSAGHNVPDSVKKQSLRPLNSPARPGATGSKKPAIKASVSDDDSDDSLIHNSEDLHFYDSHNTLNDDDDDLVIEDDDDLIVEDSSDGLVIEDPEELIIVDSNEDTVIEGSEDMIIDDIEDFSASMQTGIYQLSSEMLRALNSVTPVGKKQKPGASVADSIRKGDWVEIKQNNKRIMAKLSWRAADNSLYIFVDDGGKRVREIDGTTLNTEIESGSIKLIKNSSLISANSQFSVATSPKK